MFNTSVGTYIRDFWTIVSLCSFSVRYVTHQSESFYFVYNSSLWIQNIELSVFLPKYVCINYLKQVTFTSSGNMYSSLPTRFVAVLTRVLPYSFSGFTVVDNSVH